VITNGIEIRMMIAGSHPPGLGKTTGG